MNNIGNSTSRGRGMLCISLLLVAQSGYTHDFVRWLGDIDGDRIPEVAIVDNPRRNVTILNLQGDLVREFHFGNKFYSYPVAGVEVLPDVNGNGVPELAVLFEQDDQNKTNEVRDALTGERVNIVERYNAPGIGIDMVQLPDLNGNGVPELVSLYHEELELGGPRPRYKVADARTLQTLGGGVGPISDQGTSRGFLPIDVEVWPDVCGGSCDGVQEIGVLSRNVFGRSHLLSVTSYDRHSGSGVRARLWLSPQWDVLMHKVIRDINDDGYAEVAVLRDEVAVDNPRAHVALFSILGNRRSWGWVPINSLFRPTHLRVVADTNGNGSDELIIVGMRRNDNHPYPEQRVFIRDSKTFKLLNTVFFAGKAGVEDVTILPDIDGDGTQEIALLTGWKGNTTPQKVWIYNSRTAAWVGIIKRGF